ncbi:MAG: Dabb family protein [Ilumatobacteraceae bacterium]
MILHCVTFTFVDGTSTDQVAAVTAALDQLPPQIPSLLRYEHGPDLAMRDGTADYAVAAWVRDADGLAGYLDHPAHVAAVGTVLAPLVTHRQAVQIAVAGT